MSIRKLPGHAIVTKLRGARVTQAEIGERVGVTQSYVSRVIARRATVRPSDTTEAVWGEIERVLSGREKGSLIAGGRPRAHAGGVSR